MKSMTTDESGTLFQSVIEFATAFLVAIIYLRAVGSFGSILLEPSEFVHLLALVTIVTILATSTYTRIYSCVSQHRGGNS